MVLDIGDVTLPHVEVDKIHTFLKWLRREIRLRTIGRFARILTRNAINVVTALADEKISTPKVQLRPAQLPLLSSACSAARNPEPTVVDRAAMGTNQISHNIAQIVAVNLDHLVPVRVQLNTSLLQKHSRIAFLGIKR
jgi:hypothetical protein